MTKFAPLRPACVADQASILDLAVASGMFPRDELGEFDASLTAFFGGDLGAEHTWIVADQAGAPGLAAAGYYAPEMMSDGAWNLCFIAVQPQHQRAGQGGAILAHTEQAVRQKGGRILLIETSSLAAFEKSRAFYTKHGYDEEARIRDYYATGDDKVVFRKAL